MSFAKIFESKTHGQILVFKDLDDEYKPAIKVAVEPDEFNTCYINLSFSDDDEGFDKRDLGFEKFNLEMAEKSAKQILDLVYASNVC
jgi:hypothetical protein